VFEKEINEIATKRQLQGFDLKIICKKNTGIIKQHHCTTPFPPMLLFYL